MKKNKQIITLFLAAILIVLISGCGTKQLNSLERVSENQKLTVVGSGGYPPFNYIEDGEVVGFDVEVGEEIAKRLGVQLNYVTSDWDGLIEGLRNQRYDGILGSMAITDERLKVVNFSIPYYYSGAQLFALNDSNITLASDIEGKIIAVATGTNFAQDAEELGAKVVYYQDDNATMLELLSGRVDGVITDRLVGVTAMKELSGGENIVIIGDLLRLESMGIAMNKDDTEYFKTAVNNLNKNLEINDNVFQCSVGKEQIFI